MLLYCLVDLGWEAVDYFTEAFVDVTLLGMLEVLEFCVAGDEVCVEELNCF